ncbi:MAG: hypothetical protein M3386_04495 [Actinomycetota bacterium]|nr:hypothetical protein [Actinomycetota bacterium]
MTTDTATDADVEKVKRRQAKAEHAAAALDTARARATTTASEHDQAVEALAQERATLKAAQKDVKKLTKQVAVRGKLVKSLRKDRRSADKDLARLQDDTEQRLQKLAQAQAKVTADDALSELEDGKTKAAVRTVKSTSTRSSAARKAPVRKTSTTKRTAGKTAAKKTAATRSTAKKTPARKTTTTARTTTAAKR